MPSATYDVVPMQFRHGFTAFYKGLMSSNLFILFYLPRQTIIMRHDVSIFTRRD